MAVTLKDIAREAGTTVMTVSNVINGRYGKVSQATVDKVRAIAEKLEYVPSATARSLVARSSRLVGVLLPDSEGHDVLVSPHNVAVIGVIERMLQEHGYYVLLRSIPSSDPGSVTAALRSWNLDGAVFIGFLDSQIRSMRATLDTALVVLDSYEKNSEVMNVRLDDRKGGYLATRHLIDKGHTRIAFVGPRITERGVVKERYNGYRKALREAGIEPDDALIVATDVTHARGIEAGRLLIAQHPDVTAVFATADLLAAGIMEGVRAEGKDVPSDLSVVGFDNLDLATYVSPQLTTVTQDLTAKATRAVELLLMSMSSEGVQTAETVMDVQLVERGSVRDLRV
ncbi:LacI family DNA-binding transcriptional regulator [Mycetocola sp. 2940]|uniref:LacI family DNA-binding transcriptional regulator n=1 Tax=Mycetocola sp. 2940 TaxID=3156452 RepID=UPI003394D87A